MSNNVLFMKRNIQMIKIKHVIKYLVFIFKKIHLNKWKKLMMMVILRIYLCKKMKKRFILLELKLLIKLMNKYINLLPHLHVKIIILIMMNFVKIIKFFQFLIFSKQTDLILETKSNILKKKMKILGNRYYI